MTSEDRKMSRKAVFFDADGTVCDMKKGVPDSAIEAIRALVDNGHEAHRKKSCVCILVSGADPFYGNDQCLRIHH